MKRATVEYIIAGTVVAMAILLLVVGALRTHQVYDPDTEEYGIQAFDRISDAELTIDATFSGTKRRDGRLYSTYDRSEPRGKQACPT